MRCPTSTQMYLVYLAAVTRSEYNVIIVSQQV